MSLPKSTSRNGAHRSPLCFPRIEVTAPPADSISATSPPTICGGNQLPNRDLLGPPTGRPCRMTPSLSPSGARWSPQRTMSPSPTGLSRRGSSYGWPPSHTATSSFRKRSLVGGIGLRTRTPSMHQRRGSRRMSAMEQLPFVVRWIIGKCPSLNGYFWESAVSTICQPLFCRFTSTIKVILGLYLYSGTYTH